MKTVEQKAKRVPAIRFAGFDDEWVELSFGDIGNVCMCKRVFKEETSDKGDIPFYKIGTFGGIPDAYITKELYEEYRTKFSYPEKGDILLSAAGTIGRIVEYDGENAYFQDSNIVWLSHDESITNKFLKVLYPTLKWGGIEGSTIQRLYNDIFLKTSFFKPSIKEQDKIGSFFLNVDSLILLEQKKYDKLTQVKKSMLEKMFPKEGATVPEIRFAGFTGDWNRKKLGEIVVITMGQSPNGTTYSDVPSDFILVQGNADLKDGWVMPRIWTSQKTRTAEAGDLIMSVRAPAGAMGKTAYNVVLGRGVAGIKGDEFIYQTLVKMDLEGCWKRFVSGSTFESLNSDDIRNVEIYLPTDVIEQQKIGSYFTHLDSLISLQQRKLEKLKNIKKSLLEKMFV